MRKILTIMLVVMLMTQCVFAQHYKVNHSDFTSVDLTFTSAPIQSKVISTDAGIYTKITMDDYLPSTKVGSPELPTMTRLIEVPLCDEVVATVVSSSYTEYDAAELGINTAILPAQQAYPKSYRGTKTFSKDQAVYNRNAFYSEPLVSVEKVGVMRDVNMAGIQVCPVAYNPVTNKIRVYTDIHVSVSFVNADIPATYEMKALYGSPLFKEAAHAVINPAPQTRDEYKTSPVKYLIIAHSMFAENEDLNAFVNWKKRMGYIVEVAYTSNPNVGTTTTSIKNYILSEYNNATAANPAPSFLVFVGDHAQVPAFSSTEQNSHVTDLYYACWTSGDNIPDCYYGRFSAQNAAQLTPQINKTLMYEQYTMPDPSYLGKAVLIAGTDNSWSPTHANGQINYVYNNYINENSTTHDYTTVYKHLYNASSQAATIRAEIGAGVGWANYTAHGDVQEWYDPSFTINHISSMSNVDKYGLMIGNCCLTGKFNQDCFGEALLRAENKGAMAYIGGSEVTYWNEDVYWAVGVRGSIAANMSYDASHLGAYDRIFHTHNEAYSDWTSTASAFLQGGNLGVQSSSSSMKKYYWEIYHLFGDPGVRLYLGIPSAMEVSASDALTVGATSYQVQAAPYAYCALTFNNELIGAAFADATGNANITFDPLSTPGEYELACGAQNRIQYFKTVNVIVPEGPYVVASAMNLSQNSQPVNGYTVNYDLTLNNLGVANAANITATMTTTSPLATMIQSSATQNGLDVNASTVLYNAFSLAISADAKDGDIISLQVNVNWGNGNSTKNVNLVVTAPKLVVSNTTVAPTTGATAIFPGDAVTITVETKNEGHAPVLYAVTDLTCNYSGVVVNTPSYQMYDLQPGATTASPFTIQVNSSVPENSVVPLYHHILIGNDHIIDTLYITIGNAMETFESGDFNTFAWTNTSNPWIITTTSPYAGSNCARSHQSLSYSQTSTLRITMAAMMDGAISFFRKVSSEQNYDFFKFYIDGQEMESQSGTVAWSQVSFPVSAGSHTYKFTYSKDYSSANGSDCAWIDNVNFPGVGTMVVEDIQDNVGVEDRAQMAAVVYPNPTNGQLNVSASQMIQKVELYDMSGRLLDAMNVNSTTATLNVSRFANGIYFVKTYTEDQKSSITKFVKK
ncbi:MAG: C25 family cysteine peptidase [Bacteroidales bacterium]|nr:C25 family cysteine peptidase [Bacteroidales bacterium]